MEEEEKPINQACNILLGIAGIISIITPFTKEPRRSALWLSVLGIGAIHSIYSVIATATTTRS